MDLDYDANKANVYVKPDQQSLAIGKRGQNVRLASKLSKWELDIVTVTDADVEKLRKEEPPESLDEPTGEGQEGEEVSPETGSEEGAPEQGQEAAPAAESSPGGESSESAELPKQPTGQDVPGEAASNLPSDDPNIDPNNEPGDAVLETEAPTEVPGEPLEADSEELSQKEPADASPGGGAPEDLETQKEDSEEKKAAQNAAEEEEAEKDQASP
jgi:hypothetical protein